MSPVFQAEVHQSPCLPARGTVVDAVVSITAASSAGQAPTAAHVIIIDCSGSMADPSGKLAEAKRATISAIDTLRDGTAFAVVAGREYAEVVYPLSPATPQSRAQAREVVSRLTADGGTAMGSWLRTTGSLLLNHPAEVKHAIMLTDGRNEHESPREMRAALHSCERQFVCDTRGVGDGWSGAELRTIASALLGTADGVPDPDDLAADFQAMTWSAMNKSLGEVALRLWTPTGSTVRFVKQVYPYLEDLTARRRDISGRIGEYPTGAWGAETRDYHLRVALPAGAVGEERLAARISMTSHDEPLVETRLRVTWTDDHALSAKLDPRVAHYSGQAELAPAIQHGLAARDSGDLTTATAMLGRAVQLATLTGRDDSTRLLARLVEVIDAQTGTVRLRDDAAGVDAELANVRSVKTVRSRDC